MKAYVKLFALVLTCLMLVATFAACGGETDTNAPETNAPQNDSSSSNNQDGYDASFDRNSVKDTISTDLRFDGETVTFFIRNDEDLWKYEMDVDTIMNDTLFDAIYYRNQTVEERLGIAITTIGQAGNYANRLTWNDTLRTAVNTQSDDFDAAAIYLSQGTALAVEGMYYNVIDFPQINLDQPWWNQNLREELTLFNTLYYLAGDIAITETTQTFTMFYNKNLFDKYYASENIDLYSVVDQNKWTIDYMYDLVAPIHEDVDGDGTVNDGDVVGYWSSTPQKQQSGNDGWIAACGIKITTMVNGVPELSFYSERTLRAYDAVKKLSVTCPGTLLNDAPQLTKFGEGNQMFMRGSLNSGSSLRDMKDSYGVLPMPMLEENQEGGYATTVGNVASLVTILSSLPDNRKDMIGATLELLAAESYKQVTPAYFEIALKTKYAESKEDSDMYDRILNSITFSFGYCYSTESLKGGTGALQIGSLFRRLDDDLAQVYDANGSIYEENLQKLIDGLDQAAFNAMQK